MTVRFPQNLTVLESDGEISFSLSIAEQYEGEICFILQTRVMMDAYILDGNVNAATGKTVHRHISIYCTYSISSILYIVMYKRVCCV